MAGVMQIHIHCFTDSPEFAQRLLDYYPNLCIGITGMSMSSTMYSDYKQTPQA